MNDLSVIDQFTAVFSSYIDSGFGLLQGNVANLSAILIGIDITLAGLLWAMGGEDEVILRLIRKVLYVGAFAFIITNFQMLSRVIFQSFAGLGLIAGGSALSITDFLHPGRLAKVGVDAGSPLLAQMGVLSGFPDVFLNLDTILVLFLAWLIVIVGFFILAVQLFVTLIEFKLVTLAGFVLIPFALWNKTAFVAERVLGAVVSAGVKVLVLAVIAGIGAGIFSQFNLPPGTVPTISNALALMLAALSMLGLGIFGPGIATGLISGAPQLGAGAAVGSLIGAGSVLAAGGAVAAAGARVVSAGVTRATSLAGRGIETLSGAALPREGTGPSDPDPPSGGPPSDGPLGPVPVTGGAAPGGGEFNPGSPSATVDSDHSAPAWAREQARREQLRGAINAGAQTIRSSDHGGSGPHPDLTEEE
jgi:type IV secretion system protein TrbL